MRKVNIFCLFVIQMLLVACSSGDDVASKSSGEVVENPPPGGGADTVSMKFMQLSVDIMDLYHQKNAGDLGKKQLYEIQDRKFEEIKELMAYRYNLTDWGIGAGGFLRDLRQEGYTERVKDLELKSSAVEINNNAAVLEIYLGEKGYHACRFQLIKDKEWKIKNIRCMSG